MDGWGKVKSAAKYAGISERTFRDLLKMGLKHCRLPSGTILVRYQDIDIYFESFLYEKNEIDRITDEVLRDLQR